MKRRKNSNLHVVREPEDPTDKIIEEIMDELNRWSDRKGDSGRTGQKEKKKTKKNRDCDCGHSNCCDIGVSAD